MFIYTAKLRRGRLALGALAVALVCAAAVAASGWLTGDTATVADTAPNPKGIKTAQDRVAYIESYGWLIDPEPLNVEELQVPAELDESYADYLDLQSSQGFDLAKYRGKRLKRYTYHVENHPSGEENVQISILLYKNTVVAGEVLSGELNGFLHGLPYPDSPGAPSAA